MQGTELDLGIAEIRASIAAFMSCDDWSAQVIEGLYVLLIVKPAGQASMCLPFTREEVASCAGGVSCPILLGRLQDLAKIVQTSEA
jgi:hypothetical protein